MAENGSSSSSNNAKDDIARLVELELEALMNESGDYDDEDNNVSGSDGVSVGLMMSKGGGSVDGYSDYLTAALEMRQKDAAGMGGRGGRGSSSSATVDIEKLGSSKSSTGGAKDIDQGEGGGGGGGGENDGGESADWALLLSSSASLENRFDSVASATLVKEEKPKITSTSNAFSHALNGNRSNSSNSSTTDHSTDTKSQLTPAILSSTLIDSSSSAPSKGKDMTDAMMWLMEENADPNMGEVDGAGGGGAVKSKYHEDSPSKQISLVIEKMNELVSSSSSSLIINRDGENVRDTVLEILGDMMASIENIFEITSGANASFSVLNNNAASSINRNQTNQIVSIDLTVLPKIIDDNEDSYSSRDKSVLDKLDSIMDSFNDYFSYKYEDTPAAKEDLSSKDAINEHNGSTSKGFESFLNDLDDEYDMARQLESEKERRLQRIVNINNEIKKFKEVSAITTIQSFSRMIKAKCEVKDIKLEIIRRKKMKEDADREAEQRLLSVENNRSLWLRSEWLKMDRDLQVMAVEDYDSSTLRHLTERSDGNSNNEVVVSTLVSLDPKEFEPDLHAAADDNKYGSSLGSRPSTSNHGASSASVLTATIESTSEVRTDDNINDSANAINSNFNVDDSAASSSYEGPIATAFEVLTSHSNASLLASTNTNINTSSGSSLSQSNSSSNININMNSSNSGSNLEGVSMQLNKKKSAWGGVVSNVLPTSVSSSNLLNDSNPTSIATDTLPPLSRKQSNVDFVAADTNDLLLSAGNESIDNGDSESDDDGEDDSNRFTSVERRRLFERLSIDYSVPLKPDRNIASRNNQSNTDDKDSQETTKSLYRHAKEEKLDLQVVSQIRTLEKIYKSDVLTIENIETAEEGDGEKSVGESKHGHNNSDSSGSNSCRLDSVFDRYSPNVHPLITLFSNWQNSLKEHIVRTYAQDSAVESSQGGSVDCGSSSGLISSNGSSSSSSLSSGRGPAGGRRNRVRIGANNFLEVLEDYLTSFDEKAYFEAKGLVPVEEETFFDIIRHSFPLNSSADSDEAAAAAQGGGSGGNSSLDTVFDLQFNVESLNSLAFLEKYPNLLKLEANVNNISKFAKIGDKWGKNIESISLKDNKLVDLAGLSPVHTLKHVYLDSNQIVDLSPVENLPLLITFTCNSNKLTTFNGFSSRYLSKLELFDNKITEISPNAMSKLSSLTHLDLSRNMIGSLNGEMLSMNFLCLQTLILSHNRLADFPSPFCLPLLRTLWISGNKIQYLSGSQQSMSSTMMGKLANSSSNSSSNNNNNNNINSAFFCPLLEKLYVQDNAIREIPSTIGFSCPLLQLADFSFNQLDNVDSLLNLRYLNHLHILQINDNPITSNIAVSSSNSSAAPSAAEIAALKVEKERYFGLTFVEFMPLILPSLKILCGSALSTHHSTYFSTLHERMISMTEKQIELVVSLYSNINYNPETSFATLSGSGNSKMNSTSLIRTINLAYYMNEVSSSSSSGSGVGGGNYAYNVQSLFQIFFQMLNGQNNLHARIKEKEKTRTAATSSSSSYYEANGFDNKSNDASFEYSSEMPEIYIKTAEQLIERRYEDLAYMRLLHMQLKRVLMYGASPSATSSTANFDSIGVEIAVGDQFLSFSNADDARSTWINHYKSRYLRRSLRSNTVGQGAAADDSNGTSSSDLIFIAQTIAVTKIQALGRGFLIRMRFAKYMTGVSFHDSELDDLLGMDNEDDDLLQMGNLDLPELTDGYLSYGDRGGRSKFALGDSTGDDSGGGGMVYGDHRRPRSSKQKQLLKQALDQQQQLFLQQQQQQSGSSSSHSNMSVPSLKGASNSNSGYKAPLTDRSDFSDDQSTDRSDTSRFNSNNHAGGSRKPSKPKPSFSKPMTTTSQSGSFGGKIRTIRKQGNKGKAMPAWAMKGDEEGDDEDD